VEIEREGCAFVNNDSLPPGGAHSFSLIFSHSLFHTQMRSSLKGLAGEGIFRETFGYLERILWRKGPPRSQEGTLSCLFS